MENRNGYFQIIKQENGTYVKLFPEVGKGKKIEFDEIREYLESNKIEDCNFVELGKKLKNLEKEEIVQVSNYVGYKINEYMKVTLSENKMMAKVRFYPPSNDGERLSIDEMHSDLKNAGVVYGVDERVFLFQQKTPLYCTDFIIAKGKPVREGKDAYVEYFFNTDRRIKPKRNEDGSVDFHQLNNISHIQAGDVLAELHPADLGEKGINVCGEDVKPRMVSNKALKFGKNIELSEDKLKMMSKVNGHATLEGDRVFVSDCYDVPADVDNSTGDIDYEGNVVVHGNVRTGFKIKAAGDIEVFGTVEGAELIAGGQVILHHGMQGMTRGKIVAKGNIVSKFIESSRVFTEGFIEAEEIIQSQVAAKGDVTVNGQRGHIIGGYIRSSSNVIAKTIGSGMGITTLVEVGYDPDTQDKIKKLKEEIAEKNAEYKKSVQVVEVLNKRLNSGMITKEQRVTLKDTLVLINKLKEELFKLQEEIDDATTKVTGNKDSCVKVKGNIYMGVQLRICGDYYNVNEDLSYCKFYRVNGEVKVGVL